MTRILSACQLLLSLAVLAALGSVSSGARAASTDSYSLAIERQLNAIFRDLREFDLPAAGHKAEQLTLEYPDFALGQLLFAELMMARGLGDTLIHSDKPFPPRLLELLMEAQSRVRQSTLALDNTRLPDNLLQIGSDIEHVVAVDLEFSRLYLVKNQNRRPRIVAHHYAASGRGGYGKLVEGDLRTPTGVYQVTEFKPDSSLPDLYGAGALTLDYPNALDRHYKRTGSGIWLHGIPTDDLSRAPRSSEGCVVMPNDMLTRLRETLDIDSTLVLLSGELQWQTRQQLQSSREKFIALFNDWRHAWLDSDPAALERLHRQPLFKRAALGHSAFARQQAKLERLSEVSVDDVTIIRYPVVPDSIPVAQPRSSRRQHAQIMMQFTLPGEADSASTASVSRVPQRITLYWELNSGGQWKIVEFKQDPRLL